MTEQVASKTKEMISVAFKRYAEQLGVEPKDVQIMIYTNDENVIPKYLLMKKYKPEKEVTFNDILGVRLDFLGKEQMALPYIQQTFIYAFNEHEITPTETGILIYTYDNEDAIPQVHLYNKKIGESIKALDFAEDIFNQEKLMKLMQQNQ